MHSDDVIWSLINNGFCSFKTKTITSNFCRNEYNVNGLCSRSTCPLANSRYATIREKDGKCALYVKTVERQHLPNQLWEVIPLERNLELAFKQIDTQLAYWPSFLVHKCKQRLVKITQYLIRMRKLRKKPARTMHRIHKKEERTHRAKEARAEKVAQIDNKIKEELLERLKQGTYGDIYNFRPESWNEVLDEEELEDDTMRFIIDEEDQEDDQEDAEEEESKYYEYGGFSSGDDDDSDDDDDDDDLRGANDQADPSEDDGDNADVGDIEDDYAQLTSWMDNTDSKKKTDATTTATTTTTTTTPPTKSVPVTSTKAPLPLSKKRKKSGDGRRGPAKKSHIEVEYDYETEAKAKETW